MSSSYREDSIYACRLQMTIHTFSFRILHGNTTLGGVKTPSLRKLVLHWKGKEKSKTYSYFNLLKIKYLVKHNI